MTPEEQAERLPEILYGLAEQIDDRIGPIPGRLADQLAVKLREASSVLQSHAAELASRDERIAVLERALCEAAIPLEAYLLAGSPGTVGAALRDGIHHAVGIIRTALSAKGEKV